MKHYICLYVWIYIGTQIMVCIYTMEYYLSIKENEILPFATTWMKCESIKWNKSDGERQIPYDLIYMWHLKKNKTKKNKLTNTENRSVVTRGRGWGEGDQKVKKKINIIK